MSKALQSDILNLDITNFFGGDKNSQDGQGSCLMPLSARSTLLFGYGPHCNDGPSTGVTIQAGL